MTIQIFPVVCSKACLFLECIYKSITDSKIQIFYVSFSQEFKLYFLLNPLNRLLKLPQLLFV